MEIKQAKETSLFELCSRPIQKRNAKKASEKADKEAADAWNEYIKYTDSRKCKRNKRRNRYDQEALNFYNNAVSKRNQANYLREESDKYNQRTYVYKDGDSYYYL